VAARLFCVIHVSQWSTSQAMHNLYDTDTCCCRVTGSKQHLNAACRGGLGMIARCSCLLCAENPAAGLCPRFLCQWHRDEAEPRTHETPVFHPVL